MCTQVFAGPFRFYEHLVTIVKPQGVVHLSARHGVLGPDLIDVVLIPSQGVQQPQYDNLLGRGFVEGLNVRGEPEFFHHGLDSFFHCRYLQT